MHSGSHDTVSNPKVPMMMMNAKVSSKFVTRIPRGIRFEGYQ
jgi:hypothetical protein